MKRDSSVVSPVRYICSNSCPVHVPWMRDYDSWWLWYKTNVVTLPIERVRKRFSQTHYCLFVRFPVVLFRLTVLSTPFTIRLGFPAIRSTALHLEWIGRPMCKPYHQFVYWMCLCTNVYKVVNFKSVWIGGGFFRDKSHKLVFLCTRIGQKKKQWGHFITTLYLIFGLLVLAASMVLANVNDVRRVEKSIAFSPLLIPLIPITY